MSTLIGIAVPVNNVGTLPHHMLNVSSEYLAHSIRNNAFQITKNLKHWIKKFKRARLGFLSKEFDKLRSDELHDLEKYIDRTIQNGNYQNSIETSKKLIDLGLEGIEYYQSYYQLPLLIAISLSMIAWIMFLLENLQNEKKDRSWINSNQFLIGLLASLVVGVVIICKYIHVNKYSQLIFFIKVCN